MRPRRYTLTCSLLESQAKSAIAAVTTIDGQLSDGKGLLLGGSLLVELDEVVDAQIIDIGVVRDAMTGEILAEIAAVGA